eukprot:7376495-Prymnesium_polylepis.1
MPSAVRPGDLRGGAQALAPGVEDVADRTVATEPHPGDSRWRDDRGGRARGVEDLHRYSCVGEAEGSWGAVFWTGGSTGPLLQPDGSLKRPPECTAQIGAHGVYARTPETPPFTGSHNTSRRYATAGFPPPVCSLACVRSYRRMLVDHVPPGLLKSENAKARGATFTRGSRPDAKKKGPRIARDPTRDPHPTCHLSRPPWHSPLQPITAHYS